MPTHLTFPVNGVPVRLFAQEPPGGTRRPAVVLLHGSGGNLDFWASRLTPYLHEADVALYAPHYFDSTGTDRADLATIADGLHAPKWIAAIDQAIRFVASRPGVDPERIVLAGISLGAYLALGLAAELSAHPDQAVRHRLRAVVEVSGGLVEPYASIATEHFPPTLIVHGEQDTVVPASNTHALTRILTTLNVAHRTEILPGEGHWFSAAAVPRLLLAVSGFLEAHLQNTALQRAM